VVGLRRYKLVHVVFPRAELQLKTRLQP
jgi:hypothetical protein